MELDNLLFNPNEVPDYRNAASYGGVGYLGQSFE
jgi:hypothetical protein